MIADSPNGLATITVDSVGVLLGLATLAKALKATGDKITTAATVITAQDQANAAGIATQSAQL